MSGTSASGQRAVVIGPGVVCSRDANGCSGRDVRKRVIAVKGVAERLGSGGAGRRASAIEPRSTGVNGGVNSRSGIGSVCVSGKPRQLTWIRRARASAQHQRVKIFRRGHAIGLVATSISPFPMNIRASDLAAWRAAWRYVACWIARRVIGRGVGACAVSA